MKGFLNDYLSFLFKNKYIQNKKIISMETFGNMSLNFPLNIFIYVCKRTIYNQASEKQLSHNYIKFKFL